MVTCTWPLPSVVPLCVALPRLTVTSFPETGLPPLVNVAVIEALPPKVPSLSPPRATWAGAGVEAGEPAG